YHNHLNHVWMVSPLMGVANSMHANFSTMRLTDRHFNGNDIQLNFKFEFFMKSSTLIVKLL
ncbi:MAG: hypothetical protein KJO61_07440, partial [Deltaproteobacteria bacterium]|nr:hypothetical protein [Deltaproteobacteria bacterium]